MLEMVVVLAVMLIIGAMVSVNAVTAVRAIRLHEAGTDYANLLQQARIRAVQDDRYYAVLTDNTNHRAYIDLSGDQNYTATAKEPSIAVNPSITALPFSSGPAESNLQALFLPAGALAQASINTGKTASGPTFGPRGLPCAPVTSGLFTTCPSLGTPTSFITFLQNTQDSSWEAVTVTPAGRVRLWAYSTKTSTWSPLD